MISNPRRDFGDGHDKFVGNAGWFCAVGCNNTMPRKGARLARLGHVFIYGKPETDIPGENKD